MFAPRITVTCDCGTVCYLGYDQRWECPTCGKRWNTGQIPREQYEAVAREMRRHRLVSFAAAVLVPAVFIPLGLIVDPRLFLLAVIIGAAWLLLIGPRLRQRTASRIGRLPTWKLRPE